MLKKVIMSANIILLIFINQALSDIYLILTLAMP